MSDQSLSDKYIANTYDGLLHASGEPLPETGQSDIYDGLGNKSALSIGREENGVKIRTKLNVDTLEYPTTQSVTGKGVVVQTIPNKLEIIPKLTTDYLEEVIPNPAGTYSGYISNMVVNSHGLVTNVVATPFPAPQTTPSYLLPNAYGYMNRTSGSGSSAIFDIYGVNFASVVGVKTGLCRVTFETPMSNNTYTVIMTLNGQPTGSSDRTGTHTIISVTYKNAAYFEFQNYDDDDDDYENINAANFIVFGG